LNIYGTCNNKKLVWLLLAVHNTVCPTGYQTRNFFNNFTTNEDIATKFEVDLPHCVRNVTSS